MTKNSLTNRIIFGFAVGDALGVPFEFMEEDEIDFKFSDEMKGEGTYYQPAGTFSDDTSMMCCTIEALIEGTSLKGMADNFLKWKNEHYWTAHDEVFDIGNTTNIALVEYEKTGDLSGAATNNEYSCGNGSLMRILPLLPYTLNMDLDEKFQFIRKVSSITHGHIRTAIACFIYLQLAEEILTGETTNKLMIYANAMYKVESVLNINKETKQELGHFKNIFSFPHHLPKATISNSGYVVDSLLLTLHCFMKYNRYEMNVWYAISFGGDTDTNAALTGALAILMGGIREIPERWLNKVAKKEELLDLAERWETSLNKMDKL